MVYINLLQIIMVHLFCKGGLSIAVEGPSKSEIVCRDNKNGTCSASYVPLAPGEYTISIKFMDQHIQGSPFVANITGNLTSAEIFCFSLIPRLIGCEIDLSW